MELINECLSSNIQEMFFWYLYSPRIPSGRSYGDVYDGNDHITKEAIKWVTEHSSPVFYDNILDFLDNLFRFTWITRSDGPSSVYITVFTIYELCPYQPVEEYRVCSTICIPCHNSVHVYCFQVDHSGNIYLSSNFQITHRDYSSSIVNVTDPVAFEKESYGICPQSLTGNRVCKIVVNHYNTDTVGCDDIHRYIKDITYCLKNQSREISDIEILLRKLNINQI